MLSSRPRGPHALPLTPSRPFALRPFKRPSNAIAAPSNLPLTASPLQTIKRSALRGDAHKPITARDAGRVQRAVQ